MGCRGEPWLKVLLPVCLPAVDSTRLFLPLTWCLPSWRFAALTNVTDTQGWLLRHLALNELSGSMKSAFYLTFHFLVFLFLFPTWMPTLIWLVTLKTLKSYFPHPAPSGKGSEVDFTSELCVLLAASYTELNSSGEEPHPQRAHFTTVAANCIQEKKTTQNICRIYQTISGDAEKPLS